MRKLWCLFVIAGWVRPALAATDVQLFHLSPHADNAMSVESGAIAPSLDLRVSLIGDYAYQPLVPVIDHRVDTELLIALTVLHRLSLAAALPLVWERANRDVIAGTIPSTVAGDLRLLPKVGILDARRFGVDLAAMLTLTLPTGNRAALAGDEGLTLSPELDLSRHLGAFMLAANLGYTWRERSNVLNFAIGPEMYFRAGATFSLEKIARVPLEFLGEVHGRTSALTPFRYGIQNPYEWDVGARFTFCERVGLLAGAGRGIGNGYGAPSSRVFVALTWAILKARPYVERTPEPEPVVIPPPPASAPASVPASLPASEPVIVVVAPPPPPPAIVITSVAALTDTTSDAVSHKIQFETNSDTLTESSSEPLAAIAAFLNTHPEIPLIAIEGHTDNVGKAAYNMALSLRRADSVKAVLMRAGVNADRLRVRGFGDTRPLASNTTRHGRDLNRRVSFSLPGSESKQ